MIVKYTVTHPNLTPKQAVDGDKGYELRSAIEKVLDPGHTMLVPTGLSLEIPSHTFGMIWSKTSLALDYDIVVSNSPSIIDSGYLGEIKVLLKNTGHTKYTVSRYSTVAQLLILTYSNIELAPVLQLGDTNMGIKGFGSAELN